MTLTAVVVGMAQDRSPEPSSPEMTIYTVTPGITGFIVFFVMALAAIALAWSLLRRVRQVDHNAEARRRPQTASGEAATATEPGGVDDEPAARHPQSEGHERFAPRPPAPG